MKIMLAEIARRELSRAEIISEGVRVRTAPSVPILKR